MTLFPWFSLSQHRSGSHSQNEELIDFIREKSGAACNFGEIMEIAAPFFLLHTFRMLLASLAKTPNTYLSIDKRQHLLFRCIGLR